MTEFVKQPYQIARGDPLLHLLPIHQDAAEQNIEMSVHKVEWLH